MRKRHNGGFTFIELVLALTLFALIAAGVYRTFFAGTQMWARENTMMKETHRLRVFFNTLAQDAANAVILYRGEQNNAVWAKDRLHWTTLGNIYQNGKSGIELAEVTYRFYKNKGTLVRRYAPASKGFDEKAAIETVFLEGLEDAAFEYSSAVPDSAGGYEWSSSWGSGKDDNLPCGIKISIGFKAKKGLSGEKFEKVIFVPAGKFERT